SAPPERILDLRKTSSLEAEKIRGWPFRGGAAGAVPQKEILDGTEAPAARRRPPRPRAVGRGRTDESCRGYGLVLAPGTDLRKDASNSGQRSPPAHIAPGAEVLRDEGSLARAIAVRADRGALWLGCRSRGHQGCEPRGRRSFRKRPRRDRQDGRSRWSGPTVLPRALIPLLTIASAVAPPFRTTYRRRPPPG